MQESPESVVSRVLEYGEKIVWTGRPEVEAALERYPKRGLPLQLLGIALATIVGAWFVQQRFELESLDEVVAWVAGDAKYWVGLVVVALLAAVVVVFKLDNRSRIEKYFRSLTYAVTDRRLLILEGDDVAEFYSAEQTPTPNVQPRDAGLSDLVFTRLPLHRDGKASRDPVFRERREVAFKALRDADRIQRLIEDWIEDHQQEAARRVAEFTETPAPRRDAPPAGGSGADGGVEPGRSEIATAKAGGDAREHPGVARPEVPRAASARSVGGRPGVARPSAGRRIEGQPLGLTLVAPTDWQVQVRRKRKPQGAFFIDREEWRELGDLDAWNAVRIVGPANCRVEVEVFETVPTVTFDRLANSKLSDSVSGKVIDSQPDCEINGLRGFSVTRRNDLRPNPETHRSEVAAIVAPERHTVLHDGSRQVYAVSTWPEESGDLLRAVDAVVGSIELAQGDVA